MIMKDRKFFGAGHGLIGLVIILVSTGCNDAVQKPVKRGAGSDVLYFDYKIWGDEEANTITVNLQYRVGGSEGDPVRLPVPGNVTFDNNLIEPDSTKMNGVYYEVNIPVQEFAGRHAIIYTDARGKEYREEFEFPVISLKSDLPKELFRKNIDFELLGLDTVDMLRIIFTDTSFYGRGIDRVDTVRNGHVTLTKSDLENLRNGPVYLEFYKEEEWPLKETLSPGGHFNLSYVVKRAFELKDSIGLEDK